MDERRRRGNEGEAAAADWLLGRGYRIAERQFCCRFGEIDLIAWSPEGVLCFVEVKTRRSVAFASPREAVTAAKRRRLRTAASWYLAQRELDCPCRFDVAEVYAAPGGSRSAPRLHYIISAFE